jgi:hypothetical protein
VTEFNSQCVTDILIRQFQFISLLKAAANRVRRAGSYATRSGESPEIT